MRTLDTAFDIPNASDLRATDFVVKLDASRDPAALQKLVDDYVVTPAVAKALPHLFGHLQNTAINGSEYGHILHGGFGSGKSHLMTLLALLLEGESVVWAKSHPVFEELALAHRSWVQDQKLLVVRAHLLSARAAGDGLGDILLGAVNRTLQAKGEPPLAAADHAAVIAALRQEAADYGDAFWARAKAHGVADSMDDVDLMEGLGGEALDALVSAYLAMKGGQVAGTARIGWGDNLQRIAKHVKSLGYGGIAWMVDEFLLWLGEKTRDGFIAAINDMNTIVDHSTGSRALPMFVVFARQRNIHEFFPDIKADDQIDRANDIQNALDHHAKRFDVTQLQDVELRHIVKGRVLRDPKDPAAIAAAIDQVRDKYKQVLSGLLGDQPASVLDDVYPFHPALIDVLIDVSNLMQRERSALRMMYEILHANRDFPLGQLIPVGRAFEHIFPPAGVEAALKTGTLQAIHREWYGRLAPAIASFCEASRQSPDGTSHISPERERTLEQTLKTVLIGIVSERLAGANRERLTLDRIVALNYADADGPSRRNKVSRLSQDLAAFQVLVPELQLVGSKGSMVVRYELERAGLSEVLQHAKEKAKANHVRLAALGRVLHPMLPAALSGLATAAAKGCSYTTKWRGTARKGQVMMVNVRDAKYAQFYPSAGESFRLLIDYPWDDRGHTVDEDRHKVANVRQQGTQVAAAWLPRHFTTDEENVLVEYAAAQWIVDGGAGGELLTDYGQSAKLAIISQATTRAKQLADQLGIIVRAAYSEGEVKALIGPRDPDLGAADMTTDLTRILHELLDRKFPQHPPFEREVKRSDLVKLSEWLDEAEQAHGSTHFSSELAPILKSVGAPLELVTPGQSRAQINRNGRFLKAVTQELGTRDRAQWDPVADHMRSTYGLTDDVLSVLLCAVCASGYRLTTSEGQRIQPKVGLSRSGLVLQRARLVELSDYQKVERLARELFDEGAPAHRSVGTQDALAETLTTRATALRADVTKLHRSLSALDARDGERAEDARELLKGLSPLVKDVDSYTLLTDWLRDWPSDDEHLLTLVRAVPENNRAVQAVDTSARNHLVGAKNGRLRERIALCLGSLHARLTERERDLRPSHAQAFNQEASAIIQELLAEAPPSSTPGPAAGPVPGAVSKPPPGWAQHRRALDTPSQDDLQALCRELNQALADGTLGRIEVSWRVRTS